MSREDYSRRREATRTTHTYRLDVTDKDEAIAPAPRLKRIVENSLLFINTRHCTQKLSPRLQQRDSIPWMTWRAKRHNATPSRGTSLEGLSHFVFDTEFFGWGGLSRFLQPQVAGNDPSHPSFT
jgi:hypothetical protein